ncbi:PepSY domain-containing protein [Comamonas terrigena]|uniref:PepSY domain-containing protein n=1 Tax=Comamonas terrigena TaxID=32013 RepID=UPI0028AAFA9E|nr:PepSY domain-containing protein [Comamonas terrigena]
MPPPRPRFHLPRLRALPVLGAAACVAVLWGAIALQAPSAQSDESDHELARQALQQGKVLPLRTVLDQVEREYKGQVIKVEFEHDDGRFLYELRLLQADGRVLKVKINAVNGKVLSVRQKGRD